MKRKLSVYRISIGGIELAISVTIGILGGMWLDDRYGTKPWLLLLFMILGVAAGLRNLYRVMVAAERELKGGDRHKGRRS